MLFNSFVFLVFAFFFYAIWNCLGERKNLRWAFLTAASFLFYGWWDWRFLFLILASGLLDFFAGMLMVRHKHLRKACLFVSVLGNVGSLALFKYLFFFTENANGLLQLLGCQSTIPIIKLTLPVGISFYTFQSMSYTIDIYRGELEPTENVLHFFSFLAMFPQLVAGPIIRAADLLPQLKEMKDPTREQIWIGLRLVTHGYFKKVVIADNLAPIVNSAFGQSELNTSACFWWVVVTMFAFQIYCDFSGYSDIARGLGAWMGFDFMVNFDHPYIATSIREFWTRWHISLSTWFRDYVYVPLGGSRAGNFSSHINLWITMLVSGLWHGAAWTFVVWGGLHAFYVTIERVTNWPKKLRTLWGGSLICSLIVFFEVWIAWVFFRATSMKQALNIISTMINPGKWDVGPLYFIDKLALFWLFIAISREAFFYFRLNEWFKGPKYEEYGEPFVLAAMLAACVYLRGVGSAFIYFQF